jgi:hypothetical protein
MAGTTANTMTNPAVSASGNVDNNLIERFTGMIREQILRREQIVDHFIVQDVVNTNQVTNKSVGDTEISAVVGGQEMKATPTQVDNHSLVVDTMIMARNTMALLAMVQSDIQLQQKIAKNHVSKLIQLQDETLLTQIIKGSLTDEDEGGSGGRVSGHHGGNKVVLAAANDELDPIKMLRAIERIVLKMNEKEIDNGDMAIVVPWQQFYVLMDNEKLTNGDYTPGGTGSNGSVVSGWILKAYNMPIVPTNRIRQVAQGTGKHHQLSNASNGYRYDTLETDAGCVAIVFGSPALLVGRTMGIESDMYFNKRLKTNFIDTWFSFGAIADEFEYCGAIFAYDNAAINARQYIEAHNEEEQAALAADDE